MNRPHIGNAQQRDLIGVKTLPLRFVVLSLLALPQAVAANDQLVKVIDRHGAPLPGVAVVVTDPAAEADAQDDGPVPKAVVDQRDEQFVPALLVIRAGTIVEFPNNDTVMHHVYSFSPAKTFEIPLYQHRLPSPVRFEQPGLVVLGCNIHDQMIGHILVVDTPYFGVTDDQGSVRFDSGPGAGAELLVWHPALGDPGAAVRRTMTPATTAVRLDVDGRRLAPASAHGAMSWNDY